MKFTNLQPSIYQLSAILLLLFFTCTVFAQKAGENCVSGNCDPNLQCVKALNVDTKRIEDFCCECTQSQLDSKTKVVETKCKWYKGKKGQGWYPEKNPTYLQYVSDEDPDEDRVQVKAFDELLEESKECLSAREDRDDECWAGGNSGHEKARTQVKNMNTTIGSMKRDAISAKKVYYSSKSSYEGAMRAYNSKCRNLNLRNIERALDDIEDDLDDDKEVDCDDLEKYYEDCKECYEAAYDLVRTAFKGSSSYTPDAIYDVYVEADDRMEVAEKLLKKAKSDDLCD